MTRIHQALALVALIGGGGAGSAFAEAVVRIDGGNIVLASEGKDTALTSTGRDSEAVLSPDGAWVFFTRAATSHEAKDEDSVPDCTSLAQPDELRRIRTDGSEESVLLTGGPGSEPQDALCGFFDKQFSADGTTLYFLSPAWTTSAALHALDLDGAAPRYLIPANSYLVLRECADGETRDAIAAEQHRYFALGGSYDWFWLFAPGDLREVGPLGEFDSVQDLRDHVNDSGHCASP